MNKKKKDIIKKVRLRSLSKKNLRCEFVFGKSLEVVDVIDKILSRLGDLEELDLANGESRKVKINEWVDVVCNIKNDDYSVDVFFGKSKIVLVINSRRDKQREISEAVFEFVELEDITSKNLSKLNWMKFWRK
ncbi:hypothetical protein KAI32_02095 [Candidatus Pacearchaeota archaeon]|nr:hypothetical protein [Candidatus Pacearchaeota archaeon]